MQQTSQNYRMRLTTAILVLMMSLILAACTKSVVERPSVQSILTLSYAAGASADDTSLTALGLPSHNGESAATYFSVFVWHGDERVSFEQQMGTYFATSDGSIDRLDFQPGDSITVSVEAGRRYEFLTHAEHVPEGTTENVKVAYGRVYVDVTPETRWVDLHVASIVNDYRITTSLSDEQLMPGETFDILVELSSPAGEQFIIPHSDYEIEFVPVDNDTTLVASSERGFRVTAPTNPQTPLFEGYINLMAIVPDGPGGWARRLSSIWFTVPYVPEGMGLRLDTMPPQVTIDDAHSGFRVGQVAELVGTATDDVSVSTIRVYEGAMLLASSESLQLAAGVSEIELDSDGNWRTEWMPAESGITLITAVAHDAGGNMTQVSVQFAVDD